MIDNKRMYVVAALAAGTLVLAGCKKDAGAKEIELPEGKVHIGAQWAGNDLWIESFDPKTGTCTFVQYQAGKPVDATAITLKNCKPGAAGGMMRPNLPNMMNRKGMPMTGGGKPGMPKPHGMAQPANPPANSGDAAPTEKPAE